MRNTILAKRYAKALFAVGKDDGAFEQYGQMLGEMAGLYAEYPEVEDALTNPMYPLDARAKVMEHLVKGVNAPQVMANFFNLLVQKKRANVLPEIAEVYQAMVDEAQNVCRGSIVSATELSGDMKGKVQAALEKITGKKVVLSTNVDSSIIGGVIAKVGDLVMDGSIKNQLAALKESIKGRE